MISLTSNNIVCSSSKSLQKTSDCKKSASEYQGLFLIYSYVFQLTLCEDCNYNKEAIFSCLYLPQLKTLLSVLADKPLLFNNSKGILP